MLTARRPSTTAPDPLAELRRLGHREARVLFPTRALPLHAMVTSVGFQEERTPAYDWHGLRRGSAEFVLFQYTIAGRGMLSYEGRTTAIEPGQAMLLHFPHDNRYWLEPGRTWEFFYLCLNGREVMRLWRALVARSGPLVQLTAGSPALAVAADACRKLLRGEAPSPFAASALAYSVATALMDECVPAVSEADAPAFVERVVRFCRDHLQQPVGVDDLARAAGLSRYHFTRRFHAERGITPARFLSELRLQEAVRLIQVGGLAVKDIARRCGFSDANYFCKVFRRSYGVSPGAFRTSGMY